MDPKELHGLMEAYAEVYAPQEVDEAVKGASRHDTEMRKASAAERRGGDKRLSPSKGKANADKMERDVKYFDKITKKTKPSVVGMTHEELDIFDVVLEFLQAEGYAETLEEAEWMMANVINEEAIGIILGEDAGIISGLAGLALGAKGATYAAKHSKRLRDYPKNFVKGMVDPRTYVSKKKKEQNEDYVNEAQAARENPEKYEREQSKKYAPVRGERTPMPPRGDKRREDFEKWYAKQMSEEWGEDIMEISDRKVKAVRNAREKQWNKQFGKNRVQDPTDDMTDKIDKLIDQRNKRTGSNVKKTTMGQLHDKNVARRRGEA